MIKGGKKVSVLDSMVLNNVQRDAVLYSDGPQLVFAGAGTGKTRVLTAKIAYLIESGLYPHQILAATFTNKAAREMKTRVESFMSTPVDGLWIGTFHSLCSRILRRESKHIGYTNSFTIYDTGDQSSLMKKTLKKLDIDDRSMQPKQVLHAISRYKNACISPEKLEGQMNGFYEQETCRVYKAYQRALKELQAMDFDDLLTNTVYLFEQNPEVLQNYRTTFRYVLVDEYQDTNAAQFRIIKLLSEKHSKIFAVGDDDQSIYGWRGAQIENILSFENQFPDTRIFKLEQNYRSSKVILNFANAAIKSNNVRAQKQLWTERSGGDPVIICRYRDDRQEAEAVADKIAALNGKIRGGDIAVLFRTNAQSRSFEEAFRKRKVSYVLVGGISFYERAEIKDCLAYLRLLVNPKDDISFERIFNMPGRGLGDKAKESLQEISKDKGVSLLEALLEIDIPTLGNRYVKGFTELRELYLLLIDAYRQNEVPHEIVKQLLQLSGYIDMLTAEDTEESSGRIENIAQLVNAITMWYQENAHKGLAEFLEEVTLVSDVDSWEQKESAVNFMTLHCAKGLEFKYVYLVGLEEGILPSRQNIDEESKVEEERRLLYVGATRAMEHLECSYVNQRWRFGDIIPGEPSRFIAEIPTSLFSFVDSSVFYAQQPVQSFEERKRQPQAGFSAQAQAQYRNAMAGKPKAPPVESKQFDDFSQDTVEFRMGQYVRHKQYGRGRILSISGFGEDMRLTVLFNNGQRVKLMAKFANLDN
jgi:DNA helicase-2/ATP-dependent DNA helicase PcrA